MPSRRHLPVELHSLMLSFLTPQELLATCSHLSRHIAHEALIGLCFRTHLTLDDRAINALPTMSNHCFGLLCHASALTIAYGDAADEWGRHCLFWPMQRRSLLRFVHIHSLVLFCTSTWDKLCHKTPFASLLSLLQLSIDESDGFVTVSPDLGPILP